MKLLLTVLMAILLTDCSSRAIYENFQLNRRNDCYRLPPSQVQDCLAVANRPYEEYERERRALGEDEGD